DVVPERGRPLLRPRHASGGRREEPGEGRGVGLDGRAYRLQRLIAGAELARGVDVEVELREACRCAPRHLPELHGGNDAIEEPGRDRVLRRVYLRVDDRTVE